MNVQTRGHGRWLRLAIAAGGVTAAAGVMAGALVVKGVKDRNNYSFAGRVVLITGGSRGLGLCLARQLAKEGARLVLVSRGRRELRVARAELVSMGAEALAIPCDVGSRFEVEEAVEKTMAHYGRLDVLINNAGLIQVGPVYHMDPGDFEKAMRVHFYGPLFFSLAVIPHMRKLGGGRMVNISSIGGKVAAPHLVPYSASKFALVGLSDGLRAELRSERIFVTTVAPGLMRTGSPPNAEFKGRHRKEFAWFTVADSMPVVSMNADRAAQKIIEACRSGSPELLLGLHTKAAVLFSSFFPATKARLASLMHRMLPEPAPEGGKQTYRGWESESRWAPSPLTWLTYAAARRNNEAPAPLRE
jgi:NAD(P)-dependent dehydrogenase (short-subunit alcohol dehydrogenase family)